MTERPRILVAGSRHWTDARTIATALTEVAREHPGAVLVHGDARGADTLAARYWHTIDAGPVEPHPAQWHRYGKRAGHVRNTEMVHEGAAVCLAFIRLPSSGTLACVRLADAAGIPVRRYYA